MKKILWLLVLSACADSGGQTAYNNVIGQGINKPGNALCYYQPSGCDKADLTARPVLSSSYNGRPKIPYPRDGYVLGDDGLYWFEPLYLSRKGR